MSSWWRHRPTAGAACGNRRETKKEESGFDLFPPSFSFVYYSCLQASRCIDPKGKWLFLFFFFTPRDKAFFFFVKSKQNWVTFLLTLAIFFLWLNIRSLKTIFLSLVYLFPENPLNFFSLQMTFVKPSCPSYKKQHFLVLENTNELEFMSDRDSNHIQFTFSRSEWQSFMNFWGIIAEKNFHHCGLRAYIGYLQIYFFFFLNQLLSNHNRASQNAWRASRWPWTTDRCLTLFSNIPRSWRVTVDRMKIPATMRMLLCKDGRKFFCRAFQLYSLSISSRW